MKIVAPIREILAYPLNLNKPEKMTGEILFADIAEKK